MTFSSILRTSHALIRVAQAGEGDTVVVMIHGNSTSLDVFAQQIAFLPPRGYRVVAFDLPGHGGSGDAIDPAYSYTLPGYADLTNELLAMLNIVDPVILGWSLGGHIALEAVADMPQVRGLVLTGTPPVGKDTFQQGFQPSAGPKLAGQRDWSEAEVEQAGSAAFGRAYSPALRPHLTRADGRARERVFAARAEGLGGDQQALVEKLPMPIAIVNGADDPLINLDFIDGIAFRNLWRNRCFRIPGAGHAPFLEAPAVFNEMLGAFLEDLTEPDELHAAT
jgi:pimeloyl-ACP methyl ester carboxylesterase